MNDHLNRKWEIVVSGDSMYHDSFISGHSGAVMIVKRWEVFFIVKNGRSTWDSLLGSALSTRKIETKNVLTIGLLQPLPIPHRPFTDIRLGFVEGFV